MVKTRSTSLIHQAKVMILMILKKIGLDFCTEDDLTYCFGLYRSSSSSRARNSKEVNKYSDLCEKKIQNVNIRKRELVIVSKDVYVQEFGDSSWAVADPAPSSLGRSLIVRCQPPSKVRILSFIYFLMNI